MNINCIAIDDEPLALDVIKNFSSRVPFLNLTAAFENPMESINYLKTNKTDLIFLDIEMNELTGIQFLKMLNNPPYIIFTTAYENYAVQGFELEAVDYLLKPILFERFVKAVDKVHSKMLTGNVASKTDAGRQKTEHEDFIFVKSGFQHRKINFKDILYIEGQGDYLKIVTPGEKIMTLQSFKNMMKLLPAGEFVRVHKSYIVAFRHIDAIERNTIKTGGEIIPVSETYGKEFFKLLRSKGLVP